MPLGSPPALSTAPSSASLAMEALPAGFVWSFKAGAHMTRDGHITQPASENMEAHLLALGLISSHLKRLRNLSRPFPLLPLPATRHHDTHSSMTLS